MRKLILCLPLALALAACATSENQKLVTADTNAAAIENRALKYVLLPTADAGVKATLKTQAAALDTASGSAAVQSATDAMAATLSANHINCGPAATDSCP